MQFDLLAEPWIRVLYRDGRCEPIGIRRALADAGRIRQIAATNPMDRVAIVRFLLALLYWCRGSSPADAAAATDDSFPPDWFAKLEENKDCFNLLGEGGRFCQDRHARRPRPVTDLLQEIPTGNNFWHFRHSTDGCDGLCPACCATGLLRLPLFSVSGLPDLKSGINGTPPVYVLPVGVSLHDTLVANWLPHQQLGIPAWVQPDVGPIPGQDVRLLTGLTLLSRRVMLHDPVANPGVCIGCGAVETPLILTCEFETAGRQENAGWIDPHVVYSDDTPRKASKAPDLRSARKFTMDRPWPDLLSRIAETGRFVAAGRATALLIVGFATGRALNIDVWERTVALPSTVPVPGRGAPLVREWKAKGSGLVARVIREVRLPDEKPNSRKHVEIPSALNAIRPHVEGRASARATDLLGGDESAWEQAASEYRPMMKVIARSLSPGFTTAAVERRRRIASAVPDMRPNTGRAKKPKRRKGGAK